MSSILNEIFVLSLMGREVGEGGGGGKLLFSHGMYSNVKSDLDMSSLFACQCAFFFVRNQIVPRLVCSDRMSVLILFNTLMIFLNRKTKQKQYMTKIIKSKHAHD